MICKSCQERDHIHCLNFGVWITLDQYSERIRFRQREEPTNTWCDCAHDDTGDTESSSEIDGNSAAIDSDGIVDVRISQAIDRYQTIRTSQYIGYKYGIPSSSEISKDAFEHQASSNSRSYSQEEKDDQIHPFSD